MSSSRTQPPAKIDLSSPDLPHASILSHHHHQEPTSPQLEKSAARAMSSTDSWKPTLGGRKQSYHKEDHKHALQMSGIGSGSGASNGAGGSGGGGAKGYSEESH